MGNVTVLKHLACMWNEYSAVVDNGVRGSGIGNEQDSLLVLGNIAEEICKVAFAPDLLEQCRKGYVPPKHYIPVGERTKAGRLFLAFLCDMGYLPEGTTVETLNEWFREPWKPGQLIGHNERNLRLYKAVMDDGRLACWLKENPKNAQRFWDVIMLGKELPSEAASNANCGSAATEDSRREALRNICGHVIANDLGNWDGAREARHWQFRAETTEWLQNPQNVKTLLPPGRKRHGERATNKHLQDSFGFRLGRSTLETYGFIKRAKNGSK